MARSIQIRNVPDDVHRELRKRAAEAGVSLSAYLLREVEEIAQRVPISEILRRVNPGGSGVRVSAIVEAVHHGRDRDE
jgi:plasmid stability protein